MPYKLLGNLIPPKTQMQHMAGEIVELDSNLAQSLVERGLAVQVDTPATHVFDVNHDDSYRGGKLIEGAGGSQAAAVAESAHNLAHATIQVNPEPAATAAAVESPDTTPQLPAPDAEEDPGLDELPEQQVPVSAAPTEEEIAATAAAVN